MRSKSHSIAGRPVRDIQASHIGDSGVTADIIIGTGAIDGPSKTLCVVGTSEWIDQPLNQSTTTANRG